jgi:hypothetical protein
MEAAGTGHLGAMCSRKNSSRLAENICAQPLHSNFTSLEAGPTASGLIHLVLVSPVRAVTQVCTQALVRTAT